MQFHESAATELRRNNPQSWFRIGCDYALAQMASVGASAEELRGAARFIHILINLSEKQDEAVKFPRRELTTFEAAEEVSQPTTKK